MSEEITRVLVAMQKQGLIGTLLAAILALLIGVAAIYVVGWGAGLVIFGLIWLSERTNINPFVWFLGPTFASYIGTMTWINIYSRREKARSPKAAAASDTPPPPYSLGE